jgi:thymidylate kinase
LPHHRFVRDLLNLSGAGTPLGDVHTDRLLFATDARLTNCLIREWRQMHGLVLSQRGWMDNFIFGAVQGVSYEETDALLRPSELERPTAIIYLTADPEIAFSRIASDRHGDKYETLDFITEQHRETSRFYESVNAGREVMAPFAGIPALFIDTTTISQDTVLREAQGFLVRTLPATMGAEKQPGGRSGR